MIGTSTTIGRSDFFDSFNSEDCNDGSGNSLCDDYRIFVGRSDYEGYRVSGGTFGIPRIPATIHVIGPTPTTRASGFFFMRRNNRPRATIHGQRATRSPATGGPPAQQNAQPDCIGCARFAD